MKRIYILLIIIFILAAILGIKIYNSKNPSKDLKYSLEDIQKLLAKTDHITNYKCVITRNGEFAESRIRKENKMYITDNDKNDVIVDILQDKVISFNTSTKLYAETSAKYAGWEKEDFEIKSMADVRSSFKMTKVEEELYQKRECLKVTYEDENGGFEPSYIWIDKNNGVILKFIKTYINSNNDIYECDYSFNTVKDEDLSPDLTGYEKIEPVR